MNKSIGLTLTLIAATATSQAEYVPYQPTAPETSGASRFETVPPGEAGQIDETIALTLQLLQQRYGDRLARRGVHPKAHGCLQADFTVNPDIPKPYQVGVFATPGKKYDAWVRYSNATGTITPDVAPNGAASSRGMAIKLLLGNEGSTLLGEPGARTQDFLLINQPMFAFANVAEYLAVTKLQVQHHDDNTKIFPALFTSGLPDVAETRRIIGGIQQTRLSNPLETRYFSASPFLFGADVVTKFAASPRDTSQSPMPASPIPDDFLRQALKKSLDLNGGKPVVFDFQVQLRTSDDLPIENASAEWPEASAPFQNVATLTIQPQDFDNPIRNTECEHLVFTPWHAVAEHRPLGGINRLRLGVYKASAQRRAQVSEPSAFPSK